MSIVIVTADGPEHRYVANRIVAKHDVSAIFVCDPPAKRNWKTVLRKSPARFVDKALRQVFLRLIGDTNARSRGLKQVLGQKSEAFDRLDLITNVGKPKSGVLANKLSSLQPALIVVYGTGVIPDQALKEARIISLNMHTGISPWYRGTACAFWPIAEGKPEFVGATVHECTSEIDGGRIFQTRKAELCRGDDLHMIFARAVKVGADAYVSVIGTALQGNLTGDKQDLQVGKEYRGELLGFTAEWKARRMLKQLSKTWPQSRT